jgi:hypothetical protein
MQLRRLRQLSPTREREIEEHLQQLPREVRDLVVREWHETGIPPAIASEHKRPYHDRPRRS